MPGFDIIMQIITNLGSLPAVIAVPLILLLSDHPDYISLGQDMAVVLIISQMMVHTVKFMVYRERPFKVLEDIIANKPPTSKRSFLQDTLVPPSPWLCQYARLRLA